MGVLAVLGGLPGGRGPGGRPGLALGEGLPSGGDAPTLGGGRAVRGGHWMNGWTEWLYMANMSFIKDS